MPGSQESRERNVRVALSTCSYSCRNAGGFSGPRIEMWNCRVRIIGCARVVLRSADDVAIGLEVTVVLQHVEGGMPVM